MSNILGTGVLRKMRTSLDDTVSYRLPMGKAEVELNAHIGSKISLEHSGKIYCLHCGRETKKSFNQGYCYPCFKTLAECDMCIMRPETCHFHLGTCRDEEWAKGHCMQHHIVYIANSSGLKVGITRGDQIPTRWMDQGATQAIAMFKVKNRLHSGLLEATIKKYVSDRTDWRKMLKGDNNLSDFETRAGEIIEQSISDLEGLKSQYEDLDWEVPEAKVFNISYPVQQFPEKVSSLNLDKTPSIHGQLQGIKGQYLIFDTGVINIRKYAGYEVSLLN